MSGNQEAPFDVLKGDLPEIPDGIGME